MRPALFTSPLVALLVAFYLAAPQVASAQASQATATPPLRVEALPALAAPDRSNQLIEQIAVEGSNIHIDETRFGGETRSITVAPKGNLPVYDVQPVTGLRTWKILGF